VVVSQLTFRARSEPTYRTDLVSFASRFCHVHFPTDLEGPYRPVGSQILLLPRGFVVAKVISPLVSGNVGEQLEDLNKSFTNLLGYNFHIFISFLILSREAQSTPTHLTPAFGARLSFREYPTQLLVRHSFAPHCAFLSVPLSVYNRLGVADGRMIMSIHVHLPTGTPPPSPMTITPVACILY